MAKNGMGVLIALGKPKSAPPDDPDEMPMHGGLSKRNDAQEKPADEQRDKQGGAPSATPESVNYRTSAETCANCEYMAGDQCSFLNQPVSGGDSCGRFEAKTEDQGGEAGGYDDATDSYPGMPNGPAR